MSVFRVNKSKDYTVMSNHHLKDKSLSLKAKGLLSIMLSLPDEWDYSIKGLVLICKESSCVVENALSELKECGYLKVTKFMPNETKSGRIEYVYDIYEMPKQEGEKQGVEKQGVEFQGVENRLQLNTNNKTTNNKNIYIAPSKAEIEAYCAEKGYKIDVEYFIRYYTEGNNGVWRFKDGKPVKNWKQALVTWAYRDKPKQTPLKQTVATNKDAWERTADGGFVL